MTIEINQQRRERALNPSPAAAGIGTGPCWLTVGIWAFGIVTTVIGLVLVFLDLSHPVVRQFAIYAASCFVLAGISGALLCMRAMLAGREEFYRRGQLEGWRRGWYGQVPELDDPLLK